MLSSIIWRPWSEKNRASVGIRTRSAATSALMVSSPSDGGVSITTKSYAARLAVELVAQPLLAPELVHQRGLGAGEREGGGRQIQLAGAVLDLDRRQRRSEVEQRIGDGLLGRLGDADGAGQVALRIHVDQQDASTVARQRGAQVGGGRRLADTTLLVRHGDDGGHESRDSGASVVPNLTRKKRSTAARTVSTTGAPRWLTRKADLDRAVRRPYATAVLPVASGRRFSVPARVANTTIYECTGLPRVSGPQFAPGSDV